MFKSALAFIKNFTKKMGQFIGCVFTGRLREAGQHLVDMGSADDSIYDGFDDPLTNLMRHYPEVPDWWFLSIALISFIFAIIILTNSS